MKSIQENDFCASDIPKCLLVDDLKENIFAIKALLKDTNIEVHSAESGIEALNLLLVHDYALSLIDVKMPGMDGFELAEIMRSTENTRTIPIIFITAGSSNERRIFQGYEAGAVDFLQKPLSREMVVGKTNVFLKLYIQKIELKQKIQSLREVQDSLIEALKSRDEFLSICTHELKSPLVALKMHISKNARDQLRHGDEYAFSIEKVKSFYKLADRSVEQIMRLVNDILDASRVSTERLALNVDTVDLVTLVKEVLERLGPVLEMSGNNVEVKLGNATHVKGDRFRIEQVLTNILINASKYAPSSPVEVEVTHKNGMARLRVKDGGPGIPKEEQNHIFERYRRVSKDYQAHSLGLGLYIAKEIISKHQGVISVKSILGQGCTFDVKIPCICNNC